MSRRTDQLARIEAALERAEAGRRHAAETAGKILARLDSLDGKVGDLAEAVQVVMAARSGRAGTPRKPAGGGEDATGKGKPADAQDTEERGRH